MRSASEPAPTRRTCIIGEYAHNFGEPRYGLPLLRWHTFVQLTLLEPQRGIWHRLDARNKLRQNRIVVIFPVHKLQWHAEIAIPHIEHAAEGFDAFGNSRTEVRPYNKHHVSEASAQGEQLGDA